MTTDWHELVYHPLTSLWAALLADAVYRGPEEVERIGHLWQPAFSLRHWAAYPAPHPRYAVLLHGPVAVVAISGSQSVEQLLAQVLWCGSQNWSGLRGAAIWIQVARQVWEDLGLAALAAEGRPLLAVGHSYGGAVAEMLAGAYRFSSASGVSWALSFGAPPAADEHSAAPADLGIGWVTTLDPVPYLNPAALNWLIDRRALALPRRVSLLQRLLLAADGSSCPLPELPGAATPLLFALLLAAGVVSAWPRGRGILPDWGTAVPAPLAAHRIAAYAARLRRRVDPRTVACVDLEALDQVGRHHWPDGYPEQ